MGETQDSGVFYLNFPVTKRKQASEHHLESVERINVLKTGRNLDFMSTETALLLQECRQLQ